MTELFAQAREFLALLTAVFLAGMFWSACGFAALYWWQHFLNGAGHDRE